MKKKAFAAMLVSLVLVPTMVLCGCAGSGTSDNQSASQAQEASSSPELTESDKEYFLPGDNSGQVPLEGSLASVLYIPSGSYVPYGTTYNGDSLSAGEASIEVSWNVASQYVSELANWKGASIFYTTLFYSDSSAKEPLFAYSGYDNVNFNGYGSNALSLIDSLFGIQANQFGEPKYAKTWISNVTIGTKGGDYLQYGLDNKALSEMDKLIEHDWDGFIKALDEEGYYCGGKSLISMG